MREIQIGLNTRLRIPEGWDWFLFRGFLYRRDAFGRFVIDRTWAKVGAENKSVSSLKSA